jgi:hypothetical protein
LPRGEGFSRRLKEGYPPYRWLTKLLRNPLRIFQSVSFGKMQVTFSSIVFYKEPDFTYEYEVETNSPEPVYFQWTSIASKRAERLDGLVATVSKGKPYKVSFRSDSGPALVMDVALANTKTQDALPRGRIEYLHGTFRLYDRIAGGDTEEGSTAAGQAKIEKYGIKDLPASFREANMIFLCPAIVARE